jgi:hypothetical protein
MIKVNVFFRFNTKEEWIEFGQKFIQRKEFVKYSNIFEILNKRHQNYTDFVNEIYESGFPDIISCYIIMETKSEKTLRLLNDWIKENHYEGHYTLRDNWANKFRMDLDGLLKWWSKIKSIRVKRYK